MVSQHYTEQDIREKVEEEFVALVQPAKSDKYEIDLDVEVRYTLGGGIIAQEVSYTIWVWEDDTLVSRHSD